jgi:hypothetical protein
MFNGSIRIKKVTMAPWLEKRMTSVAFGTWPDRWIA